jgi:hypothetical protein
MIICLRLSDLNTSWERKMTAVLRYTGHSKGTWELTRTDQASAPWNLLAVDVRGTFSYNLSAKALEFWAKDTRDNTTALCFQLLDAPASQQDDSAFGSDGLIWTPWNPAGNSCDLSWTRLYETL